MPALPARSAAPTSTAQRATFLRACSLGDLAGAERALVAWARNERPDVRNLGELATRLSDEAQCSSTSSLQRARYAGEAGEGIATRLQQAFRGGIAWKDVPAAARSAAGPLPALYPGRD